MTITRRRKVLIVLGVLLVAMIGLPFCFTIRNANWKRQCLDNLFAIDAAKRSCSLEIKVGIGGSLPSRKLVSYLKGYKMPRCPSGVEYDVGLVGVPPKCPYHTELSLSASVNPYNPDIGSAPDQNQ